MIPFDRIYRAILASANQLMCGPSLPVSEFAFIRVYSRLTLSCLALLLPAALSFGASEQKIQFNRDIRPILSENCFACHGHDKNQRKAKLRLDVREVALDRGAIVPGKPKESKLVEHILSPDPDELMPPPKSRKTLTTEQKQLLQDWIAQGAEYEPHWAYIAPKRFSPPSTKNTRWTKNSIDAFILHTLESKNLEPSAEADRRTLLRRLSFDLTGLPPTLEDLSAFLTDKRPDAYERQVDRLLASPHFGERMAVPWLDVVRFADTVGYHGDQNQNIFPYRDYVIDSFNRNKPFDQFTVEQLAGDLLPHPTEESKVASGFNRLGMMTREGGAQAKEYLAKYAADRVRTVSMAWLGSTMGCCECHDHKYDPFTSKDFYSMEAFFADVKQWGVYAEYNYNPEPELKGFGNHHPFPPELLVTNAYERARLGQLQLRSRAVLTAASTALKSDQSQQSEFNAWLETSRDFLKAHTNGWFYPAPSVTLKFKDTNVVATTNFSIADNQTITFSDLPREAASLALPLASMRLAAIRLEITPQEIKNAKDPAQKKRNGSAFTLTASLKHAGGKSTKLPFHFAEADHKQPSYSMSLPVPGITDSWQISPDHDSQTAVWLLQTPVDVTTNDQLTLDLGKAALATARVSLTPFPALEPLDSGANASLKRALAKSALRRSAIDSEVLERAFLLATQWNTNALAQVRALQSDIRDCRGGRAFTMVTEQRSEPLVTRVLARGNWQDESGEIVQPSVPHFLPQPANAQNRQLTRLDLGHWLASTDNPLTARAVMNRLWKQLFGAGLSAVVDDLGAQGESPVHPELLDWLACEFMRPETIQKTSDGKEHPHPWDFKHMVRLMVASATYRQIANPTPELKDLDPNNRLLACQSPRRLEAEFVRDNALSVAGLINLDIGGPSAHPYQPAGYYANLQFPDRDYLADKDQRQYRRGLYSHWQRTFLHPMLANFDAPGREECVAARIVSNTPQQALTLLDDPTFVESARVLAQRLLTESQPSLSLGEKARVRGNDTLSDANRISLAFSLALSRSPKKKETDSLLQFLATQREHYGAGPRAVSARPKSDQSAAVTTSAELIQVSASPSKPDSSSTATHTDEPNKLLSVGLAPAPKNIPAADLAAWTQVCRVILNLHETITLY